MYQNLDVELYTIYMGMNLQTLDLKVNNKWYSILIYYSLIVFLCVIFNEYMEYIFTYF